MTTVTPLISLQNFSFSGIFSTLLNVKVMAEEFNIPENVKPVALLVMGYPSPNAKPLEMHNKYRPLEEVVFYDSF